MTCPRCHGTRTQVSAESRAGRLTVATEPCACARPNPAPDFAALAARHVHQRELLPSPAESFDVAAARLYVQLTTESQRALFDAVVNAAHHLVAARYAAGLSERK